VGGVAAVAFIVTGWCEGCWWGT